MGAYSSWPVFALTHGLVLRALVQKSDHFTGQFCILGDDVVIGCDRLALDYKAFLYSYDIPYSPTKTMDSRSTFEFAKRWSHNGKEITPFPLGAFHANPTSYPCLAETFRTAYERGWFTTYPDRPALISEFLKLIGHNSSFRTKICQKVR